MFTVCWVSSGKPLHVDFADSYPGSMSDSTTPAPRRRARDRVRRWFASTPYVSYLQAPQRMPFLQVAKMGTAAVVTWGVCWLLLPHATPAFGVIAALLVVQPSVNQSFSKAIERSVGVVIGVLVAYFAVLIFGVTGWLILTAVVVSLLLGWALRLSPSSAIQIPISAMLVLALGATTPGYAVDRVIETLIGAIVGVIVNLAIVPPVLTRPASEAISALGEHVAQSLDAMAGLLSQPSSPQDRTSALIEARLLRPMQQKAATAVAAAEESLKFNPRRGNHRVDVAQDARVLALLTILVNRVLLMHRAIVDRYDDDLLREPITESLSTEMARAAHDLRVVLQRADLTTESSVLVEADQPALTAPLRVATPGSEHWILLGSLLEDMRRVREEIVAVRDAAAR